MVSGFGKIKKAIQKNKMPKKIFIIFGNHKYKSGTSFNEAVREEFIKTAKELGHEIDLINIYEEKQIKFWDGSPADEYEQIATFELQSIYLNIQRTRPREGYNIFHCEHGGNGSWKRVLATSLYLNDVNEGAETEF